MERYTCTTIFACVCIMCADIGRCAKCRSLGRGKADKTVNNNHAHYSNLKIYLMYQEEIKSLTL